MVTGLFEASSAVTVKLKAVPAVTVAGADTEKWLAPEPPLTVIDVEVPLIEAVIVSVAVIVWSSAVFRVTEKDLVPFTSIESAGSMAWASVLVKCTIPG